MMGRHHARVLRDLDGVDLVAIADPGGDPHGVAGELDVLPDVDALIARASTSRSSRCPTRFHDGRRAQARRGGRAHARREADRRRRSSRGGAMADAFASRGLVGAVGHIERFNPALQELRRRLAAGDARRRLPDRDAAPGPVPVAHRAMSASRKDLASHDVDLTAWVAQSDYVVGLRRRRPQERPRVRGHDRDHRTPAHRRLVNHLVNWLSPMKERVTIVTGEKRRLRRRHRRPATSRSYATARFRSSGSPSRCSAACPRAT